MKKLIVAFCLAAMPAAAQWADLASAGMMASIIVTIGDIGHIRVAGITAAMKTAVTGRRMPTDVTFMLNRNATSRAATALAVNGRGCLP